jgi:hypothetical protein
MAGAPEGAMPDRLNQVKVGFRTSIIGLFVSVVLMVGLSLVYLSFDRATSIIRSAASTFVDNGGACEQPRHTIQGRTRQH